MARVYEGRMRIRPFLRDRNDALAVTAVHLAEDQRARVLCDGALARVEQPVVEARRMVEPHRVVEARRRVTAALDAVRPPRRRDEAAVAGVGDDGRVIRRILGQGPADAHPYTPPRRRFRLCVGRRCRTP